MENFKQSILKDLMTMMVLLVFTVLINSCSSDHTLIRNGESEYKIYVSEHATVPEQFAAREFKKYMKEITGCNLSIVHKAEVGARLIYVGFEDVPGELLAGLHKEKFGKEEYVIRKSGKNMLIAGGRPRGTLYGVLGYLQDLGCRWYTREVKKVPRQPTIFLPTGEKRRQPVFEYREAWYKEAYDTEWAVHNRLNPSIVPIPDSLGGSYITFPFVHTFYQLVPPEKYFKDHPEYFSLVDGVRKGHEAQLCLTNPEVVKIAIQTVFRWIDEHPEANVFSIDQNDGYGFCECDQCKKLDDAEKSHAGTVINFVNQIADTVAKVYPDIKLQTLAYVYSEIPPKTIKPRDNVTIRMCHYNYCSAHPLGGCDSHKPFIKRLKGWDKIAKRITIWDYFTDYSRYLLPYPNFERVVHDVQFYADHGCIGLFAQGSNVPDDGGGEFSELRAWVFAQLMWDPRYDGWELIGEFVDNVYGPSAPYISSYIRMLQEKVKPKSVYFSIYAEPTDGGYLTPEVVQKAEKLFQQAESAAAGDPALLKRVELAHLPVLYTRLYFYSTGGKAYLTREEMPEVLRKFKRIIVEHKITQMAERADRGDIDAFIERVKNACEFVANWWIIGPFGNAAGKGLKTVLPPEKKFNASAGYQGIGGREVRWIEFENAVSGYVDLAKLFRVEDPGVAYARRVFHMDQDRELKVGIGSNDGVRMWLNGKLVLDRQVLRRAEPNQEILTLPFKKGDNTVLIKIDNDGGGWGFYFSVL